MDINTFALTNHVFQIDDQLCINRMALRVRLGNLPGKLVDNYELHLEDGRVISRQERNQELAESCWNCSAKWECLLKVELDKDFNDNR